LLLVTQFYPQEALVSQKAWEVHFIIMHVFTYDTWLYTLCNIITASGAAAQWMMLNGLLGATCRGDAIRRHLHRCTLRWAPKRSTSAAGVSASGCRCDSRSKGASSKEGFVYRVIHVWRPRARLRGRRHAALQRVREDPRAGRRRAMQHADRTRQQQSVTNRHPTRSGGARPAR